VEPLSPAQLARARYSLSLDDEALAAECELETFVGGGPGGQHRNKTESSVRLRHLPTGIVVTAGERRSQLMNRGVALERLRTYVQPPRRATKPTRGSKRRNAEAKQHQSQKKRDRRGDW
jgi:protein subunit release factor B